MYCKRASEVFKYSLRIEKYIRRNQIISENLNTLCIINETIKHLLQFPQNEQINRWHTLQNIFRYIQHLLNRFN